MAGGVPAAAAAAAPGDAPTRANLWFASLKPPMYTVAVTPITVGSAAAYADTGVLDVGTLGAFLAAAVCIIAWLNCTNDVFDVPRAQRSSRRRHRAARGGLCRPLPPLLRSVFRRHRPGAHRRFGLRRICVPGPAVPPRLPRPGRAHLPGHLGRGDRRGLLFPAAPRRARRHRRRRDGKPPRLARLALLPAVFPCL
jgi:hypothetical protein